MKLTTLGRLLILLFITTITIYASKVEAKLESNKIYPNQMAKLKIIAKGASVEFPEINNIAGFDILNTSISNSVVNINGDVEVTKTKTYYFHPTKSVEIPSFEVKVDNQTYHTNPLKLEVIEPTPSGNGAPIVLELNTSKSEARVGEPIEFRLKFKIKPNVKADKINIAPPTLENFWVEEIPGEQRSKEGDYSVVTYRYIIIPQKSGTLNIPATYVQIGRAISRGGIFNDPFFRDNPLLDNLREYKWQDIYSNSLNIDVKPLPDNLEVYGHFFIRASVDKKEVEPNEPVNLTIRIEGEGNIDDIQKFDLQIQNAMVYNSEPKIQKRVENGKIRGVFTQKIAIVSDRDYTISPIEFKYFDSKKQKVVTIKTNPIKIKVKNQNLTPSKATTATPKVEVATPPKKESNTTIETQKKEERASNNSYLNILYLLAGFILGVIAMIAFNRVKTKEKKRAPLLLSKKVKRAKSNEELYKVLIPYAKDEYIKDKVNKLEANIYKNAKNKIDKSELIDYIEEFNIE